MMYEYLLRIDGSGKIDDTIEATEDLNLTQGKGLVWNNEFYEVTNIDSFVIPSKGKTVYIVDAIHHKFDDLPQTIKTKMLWEERTNVRYNL